jgi:hypothetical protein
MNDLNKNTIFNSPYFLVVVIMFMIKFVLPKKENVSDSSPFSGTQAINDPATAGNSIGQTNTVGMVEKLVDVCAEKLIGMNVFVYPEVINRLANLSCNDLKYACIYWNSKYMSIEGNNFYQQILGEWGSDSTYMYVNYLPALNKFKSCNLTNT